LGFEIWKSRFELQRFGVPRSGFLIYESSRPHLAPSGVVFVGGGQNCESDIRQGFAKGFVEFRECFREGVTEVFSDLGFEVYRSVQFSI